MPFAPGCLKFLPFHKRCHVIHFRKIQYLNSVVQGHVDGKRRPVTHQPSHCGHQQNSQSVRLDEGQDGTARRYKQGNNTSNPNRYKHWFVALDPSINDLKGPKKGNIIKQRNARHDDCIKHQHFPKNDGAKKCWKWKWNCVKRRHAIFSLAVFVKSRFWLCFWFSIKLWDRKCCIGWETYCIHCSVKWISSIVFESRRSGEFPTVVQTRSTAYEIESRFKTVLNHNSSQIPDPYDPTMLNCC